MKLTDDIRRRLSAHIHADDTSVSNIQRAISRSGHDITYQTLRGFMDGDTESTGRHLNAIDKYLRSKGY